MQSIYFSTLNYSNKKTIYNGPIDEHKITDLFFPIPKPHTCSANTLPPHLPIFFFCPPLPEVVHVSHEPNQQSTNATSMVLMSVIIVISIVIPSPCLYTFIMFLHSAALWATHRSLHLLTMGRCEKHVWVVLLLRITITLYVLLVAMSIQKRCMRALRAVSVMGSKKTHL